MLYHLQRILASISGSNDTELPFSLVYLPDCVVEAVVDGRFHGMEKFVPYCKSPLRAAEGWLLLGCDHSSRVKQQAQEIERFLEGFKCAEFVLQTQAQVSEQDGLESLDSNRLSQSRLERTGCLHTSETSASAYRPDFFEPYKVSLEQFKAHFLETCLARSGVPDDLGRPDTSIASDTFFAEGLQWGHSATRVPEAWRLIETLIAGQELAQESFPRQRVCVMDSGISEEHSDLKPNLYVNTAESSGESGVDDDGNGCVDDVHGCLLVEEKYGDFFLGKKSLSSSSGKDVAGHGTSVASVIGAARNGIGMVGVEQDVELLAVQLAEKVASEKMPVEEMVAELEFAEELFSKLDLNDIGYPPLEYCVANGARISNASYGPTRWYGQEIFERQSRLLWIPRINTLDRNPQLLLVVAAGNEFADMDVTRGGCESDHPQVICVGASTIYGDVASFSNFGSSRVHVLAPGSEVLVAAIPSDNSISYSQGADSNFAFQNGTSFSAPYVAGIAAMIAKIKPEFTGAEIKNIILQSANQDRLDVSMHGIVNAENAVRLAAGLDMVPPPVALGVELERLRRERSGSDGFRLVFTFFAVL